MNGIHVGISKLRKNLSKYLRRVKAGETIIVTGHGKEIGQITPVAKSLDERIRALAQIGFLEWNGKKPAPREPIIINSSGKLASDLVIEDRDVDYLP